MEEIRGVDGERSGAFEKKKERKKIQLMFRKPKKLFECGKMDISEEFKKGVTKGKEGDKELDFSVYKKAAGDNKEIISGFVHPWKMFSEFPVHCD